jgi:hypothetical protein
MFENITRLKEKVRTANIKFLKNKFIELWEPILTS